MPRQPRSPSLRLNAGSTPDSQVSTWVVKLPAASSAARNSRTSARTSSAAADRGAGASVNELLPMQCSPRRCGRTAPVLQGATVPGSRGAISARMAPGSSGGEVRAARLPGRGQAGRVSDPFDLQRFVDAQDAGGTYDAALAELRAGHKRGHWMWFVFPQLAGLGRSAMAQRYAISGPAEARAYLAHPVLGPRLLDCARAVTELDTGDPVAVLGGVDAQKLQSSMTLFAAVAPGEPIFAQVLDKLFAGVPDP